MKKLSLFFSMFLILILLFIPVIQLVGSMPGESISAIDSNIELKVLVEASDIYIIKNEKENYLNHVIVNEFSIELDYNSENIYIMANQANAANRMESDFNIRFS